MNAYSVGPFELDAEPMSLTHGGRPVPLGPKVVETLLALIEHGGQPASKSMLVERIWPEGFVEEANLTQNIYVLRKLFRVHGAPDPIATIPRYGYRLVAAVRKLAHAPMPPTRHSSFPPRLAVAGFAVFFLLFALAVEGSSGRAHRDFARRASWVFAQQSYATGRYFLNLRTREGVRKSLVYFSQVIDNDPQDARGYAAMADANISMADYCYGTHRPAVYLARAREFARRARTLDADAAEVHATLGFIALHEGDLRTGTDELRRAIDRNPSYGTAHAWYGIALLRGGRAAQGLSQLQRAVDLDPLLVPAIAWLGTASLREGRFADALAYSQHALELAPARTDALRTIGETYEALGDTARAAKAYQRYGAVDPFLRPQAAAMRARVLARAHRFREARAEFAIARAHTERIFARDLLAAAEALGDRTLSRDALRARPTHVSWAAVENATTFQPFLHV